MILRIQRSAWTVGWSLLLLVGCGDESAGVPVNGTVTLDGGPVAGATVAFTSADGVLTTADTDDAGNFTIQNASPGPTKVSVTKQAPSSGGDPEAGMPAEGTRLPPQPKALVPTKYAIPTTSGLTVDVKPGMEPVKLEMKSK